MPPVLETYPARETSLGPIMVFRALPVRGRRLVGPWCFLDRFGPMAFYDSQPMDVASHPHMGLQTVSWIVAGEVLHDDSLGSEAILRPRGVNIMTSGAGIAHSERTPAKNSGRLDGVQLWIALPDAYRNIPPAFDHIAEVPSNDSKDASIQVFAGELGDLISPAPRYSDLVGADVEIHKNSRASIPLMTSWEHGLLVLGGDCALEDRKLEQGILYYLGPGSPEARLSSREGGRLVLIGGAPFLETVLMWWNFVARTPEEISLAKTDWDQHRRFGEVAAYSGARLESPDLGRIARPNPIS